MISQVSQNQATTGAQSSSSAKLASNYETFLNLLTAQIKNQDPLSPMDTTEWTNQLVQYSSVEQAIKSNDYLAKIAAASSNNLASASNYVGKQVEVAQSTATLKDGQAIWAYSLEATAQDATLTVSDAQGTVVYAGRAQDLTQGGHSFVWDGKGSNGQRLPDGDYTLSVKAANAFGQDIASDVYLSGIVRAIQSEDDGLHIFVNNTKASLDAVRSVSMNN